MHTYVINHTHCVLDNMLYSLIQKNIILKCLRHVWRIIDLLVNHIRQYKSIVSTFLYTIRRHCFSLGTRRRICHRIVSIDAFIWYVPFHVHTIEHNAMMSITSARWNCNNATATTMYVVFMIAHTILYTRIYRMGIGTALHDVFRPQNV